MGYERNLVYGTKKVNDGIVLTVYRNKKDKKQIKF